MIDGILKNKATNATFPLTGHDSEYQLVDISGLAPVPATLNIATVAGMDGARYNSSRADTRNIVITLKLNDAANVRQTLEESFATKTEVELTLTVNGLTVKTDGYIDTFECEHFSASETAQISIICPNPYFQGASPTIATIGPGGASIATANSIETGVYIRIAYNSATASRSTVVSVINPTANKAVTVEYEFSQNDIIEICTVKGRRSVQLIRNGVKSNIFSALVQGSEFWGIKTGQQTITYSINGSSASNPAFTITVEFTPQYAGV